MNRRQASIVAQAVYQYMRYNGESFAEAISGFSNIDLNALLYIRDELGVSNEEIGLDLIKKYKIKELSEACKKQIENGVDVEIRGNVEHFAYSIENGDQTNIDNLLSSAAQTKMAQPYHCDGGSCKMYSPEEIISIYIAQLTNKTGNTTYYNQLKLYVLNELQKAEDVLAVKYGQELTGAYLENYKEIIAQSQAIVEQFISNAQ